MANFCNKCGSPVSGVFCVKCGADTRAAAKPASNAPQAVAVAPNPPTTSLAKFCNKCGAPAVGTTFCNACGASLKQASASVAQTPPPPFASAPSQPTPITQGTTKSSPAVKILVGFLIVVIVFGALAAGGVYYVVYRVKKKVHEVADQIPGVGSSGSIFNSTSSGSSSGSGGNGANGGISGDPCRLLSKDEVGRAIGVEIVATSTADGGCSYLAKGNSGDMTAKHMSAMVAGKGADAKTQQMIQGITGGMFKAMQSDNHEATSDANGNVPVFTFSIDNNSADTQMQLNQKVLGGLGPGQQEVLNIGDQAFDEAGAMMMVRKGDKLIRIMYSTCPCGLEQIKPLAKRLADRL
jgi:hypothetical protein